MLQRALIIDDEEDTEVLVRLCMHAHWPEAVLEMYDPKCGMPDTAFDWSRYDLLILDYDLGLKNENGLTWLSTLIRRKDFPPTIMLTSYATDKLAKQSTQSGADEFLDKGTLNPELFFNSVAYARKMYMSKRSSFVGKIINDEKTTVINPDDVQFENAMVQNQEVDETTREEIETRPTLDHVAEKSLYTLTGKTSTGRTAASKRAAQPADINLVVPGYRLLDKIGEGGMASIYLAQSDLDGMKVVLKVLSLKDSTNSNLLRRFMREYKLIAQIKHENIVQIYERAFSSDFAYIAMEYFEYGDLAQKLQHEIDSDKAILYLKQIAAGLGAAHEQGIVHRDMKPANILFRSEDSLAITDFGIAKDTETKQMLNKQLTMEGELMGTIYYISPEQIEGAEADQRSDIYSLGVIMYKLLTGEHPYSGKTLNEVFDGHLYAPIPRLPQKYAKLQPLLDGLLAKDPDERFQSTEDLLMGLDWK